MLCRRWAGAGDVSVALAELVGRSGRVYAVDSDPRRCDEVATAAAATGGAQVVAVTQAGEDLALPNASISPTAASCCCTSLSPVRSCCGWRLRSHRVVFFSLRNRSPRQAASMESRCPCPTPPSRHWRALLPGLVRDLGLELVDAWAEAPAGAGPGVVSAYLEELTELDPGGRVRCAPAAGHRHWPRPKGAAAGR